MVKRDVTCYTFTFFQSKSLSNVFLIDAHLDIPSRPQPAAG
jgi:hypothetical protein